MEYEFVIIGGGVAGLCAALRLTELGAKPLLIEAGNYPSHKVCGEFFSPQSIPILKQWEIHPIPIQSIRLHVPSGYVDYTFPNCAGSLSHWHFDKALANRASSKGATILTNTRVEQLQQTRNFKIQLSGNQSITTPNLIVATGRIPNVSTSITPSVKFIGIKAHFEGIPLNHSLQMFSFNQAYVGLSPIEEGKCNIACLASSSLLKQFGSATNIMENLRLKNPHFNHYLSQGTAVMKEWMVVNIPKFGMKPVPQWPNAFFIGDAIGTTAPITGNGLSMAIQAGIMAAEFAKKGDSKGFHDAWKKQFSKPISYGKIFHYIGMKPSLYWPFIQLSRIVPSFKEVVFHLTR